MENEACAPGVALDYSQLNGAPYKPDRFRLAGETDPADAWTDSDLPLLGPARRQTLHEYETSYEVIIADPIDEGLKLQQEGLNPVVLNVASADVLVGGYHCGTTPQEQDIFKRTDYSSSLHEDLKLRQRQEHVAPQNGLHPHGKFGALYSKLVVFRCGVGQEYKLMSETAVLPFIVMSDNKRNEPQAGNHLQNAQQIDLLKKILLLCEVALHKGHTTLVLGALGSGHPSALAREVALLFLAALSCFHGCFYKVVFAIDDAAGGQSETFKAYADVFGDQSRQLLASLAGDGTPPKVSHPAATLDHPYCLCPVAWAHIRGNGGAARSLSENSCPWIACANREISQMHRRLFWHPPKCKNWEQCEAIDETDHKREFSHPPKCPGLERCSDFRLSHMSSYWHPVCWHQTRPEVCTHQSRCPHFLDKRHCSLYIHPFRSPCVSGHLCKIDPEVEPDHWANYAHVCESGQNCALLLAKDPEHISRFVHPDLALLPGFWRQRRPQCPEGQGCQICVSQGEGRHRLEFAHEGEAEYYLWRKQCHRRDCQGAGGHAQAFFHKLQSIPRCPFRGINTDVDFVGNHRYLLDNMANAALDLAEKDVAEVEAWISRLRPTHRCKLDTFQSMLRLGAMVSTGIIDDIHRQSHQVVSRVAQDIAEHNPVCHREYQKYEAEGPICVEQLKSYVRKAAVMKYQGVAGTYASGRAYTEAEVELEKIKAGLIGLGVQESHLSTLAKSAEQVALACHSIKAKPDIGIGYSVDRHLNTHQNIFAILGPHTGQYYGHICLVLKRDVLLHPDTYLLANAATAFNSGDAHTNRPWCPVDPTAVDKSLNCEQCKRLGFESCEFKEVNKKVFEQSKLHPCIHQWQRLLAQEMLGQAKHLNYEASLRGVQRMWYEKDSHTVIEAHLPALVHFGYVEKIVMTTEQRGFLTELDWAALSELFQEATPLECKELPRDDRHKFKPAFDQTRDLAEAPCPDLDRMGICTTLPPCDFDNKRITLLPLSLRPYAAPPVQHLSLKANRGATFCLVLARSARHLRDHRSAKEADFVTIMLANGVNSASAAGNQSALFIGRCLPKHPDMIFDSLRESEFRARGMCYVWDFDEAVCETDCFRSYCLRVDSSGQVIFSHYGADTFLNRKVGVYSDIDAAWLRHQVHVGILTFNKSVSFVDVVARSAAPPSAMPLDSLLESAHVCREEDLRPHLYAPLDDCGCGAKDTDSEMLPPPTPSSWSSLTFFPRGNSSEYSAGAWRRKGHSLLSRLRTPFRPRPACSGRPLAFTSSVNSLCRYREGSGQTTPFQSEDMASHSAPTTCASPVADDDLQPQAQVLPPQRVTPPKAPAKAPSEESLGSKATPERALTPTYDAALQGPSPRVDAPPTPPVQEVVVGPERESSELPLYVEMLPFDSKGHAPDKPWEGIRVRTPRQPEVPAADTEHSDPVWSEQPRPLGVLDIPAPDPSCSELLIHKGPLPLSMCDAPDPEKAELFVHKQVLSPMLIVAPSEVSTSPPVKMSL